MFASNFHRKNNKRLLSRPLHQEGGSYSKSAPQPQNGESKRTNHDNFISKRVLSAKEQRLKQTQDQLSVAHTHIRELSNENRILHNMQKRMEFALQRYEGTEADIPKLLNSHQEEIRLWRTKQTRLRDQLKETSQRLKNKEQEYQKLHTEHKRLIDLTKNMNLGEREKLQLEIDQLNERLKKNNETINLLQRKLLLKSKSHKYRLQTEMLKHKETQMQLKDAISNYEKLTEILVKKDKTPISNPSTKTPRPMKKVEKIINTNNEAFQSELPVSKKPLAENASLRKRLPTSLDNSVKITNNNMEQLKQPIVQNTYTSISLEEKSSVEDELYLISSKYDNQNNIADKKQRESSVSSELSINLNEDKNITHGTHIVPESSNLFVGETFQPSLDSKYQNSSLKGDQEIPLSTGKSSSLLSYEINEINSLENTFKTALKIDNDENSEVFEALEAKSTKEQNLLDDIINNYCNDVLQNVNNDMINLQNMVEPSITADKVVKKNEKAFPEENNNSATSIKKLDEEKKRKLLATLKAIDSGEIDGLAIKSNLNSRRKSKQDNLFK